MSHRSGRCEAVERTGWMAAYGRFAKEKPCTCKEYREKKKK